MKILLNRLYGLDVRSVGLFRITLGLAIIADLFFNKLFNLKTFYTEEGLFPNSILDLISQTCECSLLFYINSHTGVLLFFFGLLVLAALYTIGFKPKWIGVLLYVGLFSLHERNAPFLMGGDAILRLTLFWSLFLPLSIKFTPFGNNKNTGGIEVRGWGVWAILLQFAVIYLFNGMAKTGATWWNGEAIGYALMLPFAQAPFSELLLQNKLGYQLATYFVLLLEFLVPLSLFFPRHNKRYRLLAAFLIFSFHWGGLLFFYIGNFYLATLPFVILLIPDFIWDKITALSDQKKNVFYSPVARWGRYTVVTCLCIVLLINIESLFNKQTPISNKVASKTCNIGGLKQRWRMFAPDPPIDKLSYPLIVGKLQGQKKFVDLYSQHDFMHMQLSQRPYDYVSAPFKYMYVDYRMYQFLKVPPLKRKINESWGQYEMDRWNKTHPRQQIDILYVGRLRIHASQPGRIDTVTLQRLVKYPPEAPGPFQN
jgi:hypothetical protein